MKKFILSISVIGVYLIYIVYNRQHLVSDTSALGNSGAISEVAGISSTPTDSATQAPAPSPTVTVSAGGESDDGQSEDGGNSVPTATPTPTPAPTKLPTPTQKPVATPTPTPTPAPTKRAGQFADGQYTGSAVDVFYGTVQVQAVILGGKLTDVKFLQYPSDRGQSREISNYALPILRSEAISAQSANVDGVSGATQTSDGFNQSLAAALRQAKS